METLNRVQLIGQNAPTTRAGDNLGQSAKFHEDWQWSLSFSVATKNVVKTTGSQEISDPCWHRITVHGDLAKHCFEILRPGVHVFIEGQIVQRKYGDTYSTDIEAQRVDLLS